MVPVPPQAELRNGRDSSAAGSGIMGPQDGVDLLLRAIDVIVHDLGRDDCHFALLGYGDCLAGAPGPGDRPGPRSLGHLPRSGGGAADRRLPLDCGRRTLG